MLTASNFCKLLAVSHPTNFRPDVRNKADSYFIFPIKQFERVCAGAFIRTLNLIIKSDVTRLKYSVMGLLYQIVYTSTAADSFSRAELIKLLKGSVQRNTQMGITGLLLYQDGTFMQVLEGEEAALIALFARISRDPRHHHVIPLIHEPIERRNFSNSAMAFRDLDASELRNLRGYSEFLNTPLNGDLLAKDIPKCQRLLLLFKENIH